MKPKKKSKQTKIFEAIKALQKAIEMEDPDISINIHGGFVDTPESREFVIAVKTFAEAYKKFWGEKPKLSMFLD